MTYQEVSANAWEEITIAENGKYVTYNALRFWASDAVFGIYDMSDNLLLVKKIWTSGYVYHAITGAPIPCKVAKMISYADDPIFLEKKLVNGSIKVGKSAYADLAENANYAQNAYHATHTEETEKANWATYASRVGGMDNIVGRVGASVVDIEYTGVYLVTCQTSTAIWTGLIAIRNLLDWCYSGDSSTDGIKLVYEGSKQIRSNRSGTLTAYRIASF